MDNTIVVTCLKCGHSYELAPAKEDPKGGGWYSSDKDFCRKCDGNTKIVFKDGRQATHSFFGPHVEPLKN